MKSELTPNQKLLLWHLGLRGGEALQMEVEYKEISKDRKELDRLGFLEVGKKGRSFVLKLKEGGWNELATPGSILPKAKKSPSRERAILQLLLDAMRDHVSKGPRGIGEVLRDTQISLQVPQKIRRAFFEIAGNPPQDSVRLSALRAKLLDVPRQQIDEALLAMKSAREINLMNLDNPRDVKAEEPSALDDGNRHYHVLWIER